MRKFTLGKEKIKVLLLEGPDKMAVDAFHDNGYINLEYIKEALTEEELIEKAADAHMIGLRSKTQITEAVFKNAPKLFAVGCFCIGTNQVDLGSASRHGIPVFNAPFSNTRSVAELIIAEIIMLLRDIPLKNFKAHQGVWEKSATASYEVRGKTLGIIGYGHIGSQVGLLAESLGMNILYYDIDDKLRLGNANPANSLEKLLTQADVMTLHVPSTPMTRGMIGKEEIAMMKSNACVINASRGDVMDVEALADALKNKKLAGAAVDVFPIEPSSNSETFDSPLRNLDNVILTPHIGGSTKEAQKNIALEVAERLIKYSDNGSTTGAVNFPSVILPARKNMSRFLHIHSNMPGVLEAVNNIFSRKNINIASQYLQTVDDVGYLVGDIEGPLDASLCDELRNVKYTIKARSLYEPK
jgi:D-3-phosphoglycerate dehydrogenase / 2-oxoglutarate reductase